ncbi:hypothetical protein B0H11DRAFT_2208779 [Mycena galericulata]|nr:hypothetical protein B0H11DRAFT_2208779 [Mycena galericulata]
MKKGRQEGFSSASHCLATASPTRSRRLSAAVGALEDERKKQDDILRCNSTFAESRRIRTSKFSDASRFIAAGFVTKGLNVNVRVSVTVELLASVKLSGTLTAVELGRWMLLDGAPAAVSFACPTDTLGAALVDVVELRASETLLALEADFNMELVIGAVLLALVADILWDVADGLDLAEVLGPTDVLDLADTLDFADALDLAEALDREAVLVTLKPATTSPSALGGPYHQRVV